MGSTFSGIEIGKRGLQAHTQALHTVGHNLDNASTEGYSRQRIKMQSTDPLYAPQLNREERPGQIGQGVDVASVERIRDTLLEDMIISQGDKNGYWEARRKYLDIVGETYLETDEQSVRKLMDDFWVSWGDLAHHPEEMGTRNEVLRTGESLIDGINDKYYKLNEIRTMLNDDVYVSVEEVNSILNQIKELNINITKSKALGDNPNDMLDKRDLLVDKLSRYLDITVDNRDPDEFQIHTGGRHLIQGEKTFLLNTVSDPTNSGFRNITWGNTGEIASIKTGKLGAIIELRDQDLRQEIQKLDQFTINFTDMVNDVHKRSYGLNEKTGNNFFVERPIINNVSGNYDRTGDGEYDSSYIFRITGSNELDPKEQIGLQGEMILSGADENITVPYFSTDTVEDVLKRINNANAEVIAVLDVNNKLVLKATPSTQNDNPDFVLRHIEDSGQFLAGYTGTLSGSGEDGAYDWGTPDAVLNLREGGVDYAVAPMAHPAAWLTVNPELLSDPASIAATHADTGGNVFKGDGSAALEISQIRFKPVMVGKMTTFNDFFSESVANIGLKGKQAIEQAETASIVMKRLKEDQQSISGVSIDEEMAEMIKFQHGYAAAAKFVTVIDKMLDTIINGLGV